MHLKQRNGQVLFMDLPVNGTTVRAVEKEKEQNLILRAAIDYGKRDRLDPAPSYERRYNESSHRAFLLAQTCLSAGDLLKHTMRDIARPVVHRTPTTSRDESALRLPPLAGVVPEEDTKG